MGKIRGLLLGLPIVLLCACGGGSSSSSSGPSVTRTYNLETLSPFPGISDWSTAGGGSTHSGYVPVTLNATNFSARWSVVVPKNNTDLCDNEDGFFDCVSIYQAVTDSADGKVVAFTDAGFGSANSDSDTITLTGLDEQDGSIAWSQGVLLTAVPGDSTATISSASPATAGGKVYFSYLMSSQMSPQSPVLEALDIKTGTKVFSVNPPCASPCVDFAYVATEPVVADSVLYTGSPLSAYDAGTGAFRWTSAAGSSAPAIGPGALYLSGNDLFTALSPTSGSQLFQVTESKPSEIFNGTTAPMLDGMGGAVVGLLGAAMVSDKVVTPAQGLFERVSLSTHAVLWTVLGDFSTIMQPAVGQGVVYACDGTAVTAYAVSDGAKLWSWTGDSSLRDDGSGNSNCSLLVTNNLLFVSSYQVTSALDLTTHAVVWSWPEGGQLSLSPSGLLYISVAAPAPTHLVAINLH